LKPWRNIERERGEATTYRENPKGEAGERQEGKF
jgi:hypothetical protein